MQNAATGIGLAVLGIGIAVNGLNSNGTSTAVATPAAFNAGPEEPTIVWYDSHTEAMEPPGAVRDFSLLCLRAWSDGTVEGRLVEIDGYPLGGVCDGVRQGSDCSNTQGWFVISSPNEGLNAAADVNFDERVDGSDLAQVLAYWGDAPRNDYPPSDCPLGLIP